MTHLLFILDFLRRGKDSVIFVFCGPPGFLMLMLKKHSGAFFFLFIHKRVDLATPKTPADLCCFSV